MKKNICTLVLAAAFAASALTGCNKNENSELPPSVVVISFEQIDDYLVAGPTSYGENLYSSYEGERFTTCNYAGFLTFGISEADGSCDFWNGGIAVSNWNLRSNPADKDGDWWYSYLNQCSVYNLHSKDGMNRNAGNANSERFAVVNSSLTGSDKVAEIATSDGSEHLFFGMYVCNTAYTYGVIMNGNDYARPLPEQQGYLELVVQGFKAGSATPVAEDRFVLADFRGGNSRILETWAPFVFDNLGRQPVSRIVLTFDGSDVGEWGLNTPTYVCIDDLNVSYAPVQQ